MTNKLIDYENYWELCETTYKLYHCANVLLDYCLYNDGNEKILSITPIAQNIKDESQKLSNHF